MNESGSLTNGNSKNKIVYIIQVVAILLIIIFCLVNLTWQFTVGNEKLWIGLLGSCIGYLLPNPRIKRL